MPAKDLLDRSIALDLPGFENLAGVELVQKTPLFRTLSFDETVRLFKIAVPAKKAAGDIVIEDETMGTGLYIVRSGRLQVKKGDRVLGSVGPGEIVGEMSLIDDVLTSSEVVAVEECELLMLPRATFDTMLATDKDLAVKVFKAFCRTLADRLRKANELLQHDDVNGVR